MPIIDSSASFTDGDTQYEEDGFILSVSGGFRQETDGPAIGEYLTMPSNQMVQLVHGGGGLFGITSIAVDGFLNDGSGGGDIRSAPAAVTITFLGFNPNITNPAEQPTYTVTTNNDGAFETIVLPAEFASGLAEVYWSVSGGGTNAFLAFDNIALVTNSAPTATGVVSTSVRPGDFALVGQLGATDPDGDTLSFSITNHVSGVSVTSEGAFVVERQPIDDDLLPGETRTVTFEYEVSDGFEIDTETVTVTVSGLPQGADIRGGNHPQKLVGTALAERMYGGNQHDTLCGNGGADTLAGENGNDVLHGGSGRDRLLGGNGKDTLNGDAGNDILEGGNSSDRLDGGLGDDTMTGGNSPDEFYFGQAWGRDVITDFDPKNEHIHFSPSPTLGSWADFQTLKSQGYIKQVGANVVIDDTAGNTLTLLNVKLTSLGQDDFIFG